MVEVEHLIDFFMLHQIGGKRSDESNKGKDEVTKSNPLRLKTLCTLGIATSIDALAIGVSIAFLHARIAIEASVIAGVTFLFSAFGVYFGNHFGKKLKFSPELIGGIILIGLGVKILIEHIIL